MLKPLFLSLGQETKGRPYKIGINTGQAYLISFNLTNHFIFRNGVSNSWEDNQRLLVSGSSLLFSGSKVPLPQAQGNMQV